MKFGGDLKNSANIIMVIFPWSILTSLWGEIVLLYTTKGILTLTNKGTDKYKSKAKALPMLSFGLN